MFNKFPKRTGIYHIKDEIEHLELKVTFRHINSLLKLPKFDYNKNISPQWLKEERNSYGDGEITEVHIKWQEKLFSSDEEKLYKDLKNCRTEIQQKYNDWLLKKEEAQSEVQENKSKKRRKKRPKKQQQQQEKHQEQQKEEVKKNKGEHEIYTYINEDNFQHKDKNKEVGKSTREEVFHMYVFAKIDVDTELVHLEWHSQERMLHIYPDFNSFSQNPYFIEIDKDYRHLYAYGIENISKARTTLPGGDLSLYLELPELKPHWRTEEERAALFAMPPKRTRRISLLLEIREASHFEYDSIHVRYQIHLPENTIHEEGLLQASTHSSSMSDSGVHHFGYNWQLTLLCEEDYDPADLMHIYFEVISIDSWERERLEGYAFLAVNLIQASNLEFNRLQCLRPVDSFFSELERFFIGGRRKFDFVRFFGQESRNDDSNKFHCLYGIRMKSTGFLKFSYQSFTQRNCELLEPRVTRRSGMTLDDIMLAYREARERLESLTLK